MAVSTLPKLSVELYSIEGEGLAITNWGQKEKLLGQHELQLKSQDLVVRVRNKTSVDKKISLTCHCLVGLSFRPC